MKDSLNPFLYYKRAHVFEANKDYKAAIADMHIALRLDSLEPEYYLYSADFFKQSGAIVNRYFADEQGHYHRFHEH